MKLHKSNKTLIASIATMSLVVVGGAVGFATLSDILTPASAEAATSVILGQSGYNLSVASSSEVSMDLSGSFLMSKSTLNTKTNANGFSLYMGMQDNTNSLYLNGDSSSTALPSVSNTYSYTSPGSITNNTWGYAIPQSGNTNLASGNGFNTGTYTDSSTSESDTKWASVPVKGKDQIVQSTTTANNTTGIDLNVFYAVKANASQAAGVYKGTIVYTAVAKSSDANIASSSPSTTKKLDGGETLTITIGTNTPYSSLTTKTVTIGNANQGTDTCTITGGGNNADGTLYLTCTTPKKKQTGFYDINIDLGSYGTYTIANGIEYIYKGIPKFFTTEYMQDFNQTICATVETPSASLTDVTASDGSNYDDSVTKVPSTTIKDKRDEQVYTIRKLADGNCWMTENLRYGINPDGSTHPWVSSDAALTDTNVANTLNNIQIETAASSVTVWQNSYEAPYIAITGANDTDANTGTKWGALYNYCAASGGTNCNPDPDSDPAADATGSICPKGWTMPSFATYSTGTPSSSDVDKSYQKLLNTYGVSEGSAPGTILSSPVSFPFSGYFHGGGLVNRGDGGYFWSSSAYDAERSFILNLASDEAIQGNNNRRGGRSVRCLASS